MMYKNKNETKGIAVSRFFVEFSEKKNSGQGVISTTCKRLWEMSDKEFKELFGD